MVFGFLTGDKKMENMRFNSVADMFRTLMTEQGLSVYELAKKAGVGESHLKKITDGRVRNPGKTTIDAILGVLAPGKCIKRSVSLVGTGDAE